MAFLNKVAIITGTANGIGSFIRVTFAKEPGRFMAIKQLTQLSVGGAEMAIQSIENTALSQFYQSEKGQSKSREFYQESLKP